MPTDKPWLKTYPPEIPAEIDLDTYASIVQVLEQVCVKYCDRPAFSNFGTVHTYRDLDRLSAQFAAYLHHQLRLERGDRVAIMLPNILQYPIAVFGILRAGLVVVNTNPLYTTRELKHQLSDSGARAIVVLENFAKTLEEVLPETNVEHVLVTRIGDCFSFPKSWTYNWVSRHIKKLVPAFHLPRALSFWRAVREGERHAPPPLRLKPDDIAFLQYTGGTTGVAKGAILTHRNMVANMLQASAWFGPQVRYGQEVMITALPLYHIFALTCNCLTFMHFGGLNVLITNPRDMRGFVKELKKLRFTAMTGVNTLFNNLMNTSGFEQVDFRSLHMTFGGGMAVQRAVAERWKRVTGCSLTEGYGMTESAPVASLNLLGSEFNGSIGLPAPSTELSIQDDAGNMLPIGEIGELCIRGPQVMQGYWQKPEETAKVLSADGWLRTGDMGRMDAQGYFYIVDRKKDMILVSGFNVYPNEIEDVLAAHPGVLEVAAVGVPDEKSGEAVKVVIVRKDKQLTSDDIKAFCKQSLTGYKMPKIVEFRDSLPKTNVGKILRRELRQAPP